MSKQSLIIFDPSDAKDCPFFENNLGSKKRSQVFKDEETTDDLVVNLVSVICVGLSSKHANQSTGGCPTNERRIRPNEKRRTTGRLPNSSKYSKHAIIIRVSVVSRKRTKEEENRHQERQSEDSSTKLRIITLF